MSGVPNIFAKSKALFLFFPSSGSESGKDIGRLEKTYGLTKVRSKEDCLGRGRIFVAKPRKLKYKIKVFQRNGYSVTKQPLNYEKYLLINCLFF